MPSGAFTGGGRLAPRARSSQLLPNLQSGTGAKTNVIQAISNTAAVSPTTAFPSSASSSNTAVNSDDLVGLFECPVCFDYAIPPLLQCQSGHMVCQPCREKLSFCPTCRGPIGNIRNLAMEKVASTLSFPCRYSNHGCSVTMSHTLKLAHEENCELRPYSCPCPGAACRWTGNLSDVIPHLLGSHKSITTLQGEDIVFLATDISLPGAVDWVMMQSCFGQHFMLILEKQEKVDGSTFFYAVVQFVGNRKDAQNFAYRLELNAHGNRRRLTWEANPKSIHEGVYQALFSKDCLMFDSNIANLFAENGNLGINVTLTFNGHMSP
ncbi:E3 ubiquitin-protein ligase Siah1 [Hypsibius exemplaris]|uniref:E3 ubiquitin-protein ligase n=1 Tax=Hypsibius exemplaris TaxID=2072580 RepID=A0A9X6NB32_HYPEX|nr:E3 ubiquitin-protein ligase Siah1 [Hypsibius exemplaris]